MRPNILVFGKTGQLARALAKQIRFYNCKAVFIDRATCDLSGTTDSIKKFIKNHHRLDAVIIAAAYTNVDLAETEPKKAFAVNEQACAAIATGCKELDIPLVHISTDYVFDGEGHEPYLPHHQTAPLGVYGASKLAGEKAISQSGCRAVILRTSWVFDGTGKNFLTTMLRLGKTHNNLRVVNDQIGRPTYAGHLAQATLTAVNSLIKQQPNITGIFHVSGSGAPLSWATFAEEIFLKSHEINRPIKIIGIPSSEYPQPASRPKYSVLDLSLFEDMFDLTLPDWKLGLSEALNDRKVIRDNVK